MQGTIKVSAEEKRKILNDHDLRMIVEQNVELRHQDTLSVATLAVASAAIFNAVSSTVFPDRAKFSDVDAYQAAHLAVIVKTSFVLSLVGIMVGLTGAVLRYNAKDALQKMKKLYVSLRGRNGLEDDKDSKVQQIGRASENRFFLPDLCMWLGFGALGVSFLIFLTFEYGPAVRHYLITN